MDTDKLVAMICSGIAGIALTVMVLTLWVTWGMGARVSALEASTQQVVQYLNAQITAQRTMTPTPER